MQAESTQLLQAQRTAARRSNAATLLTCKRAPRSCAKAQITAACGSSQGRTAPGRAPPWSPRASAAARAAPRRAAASRRPAPPCPPHARPASSCAASPPCPIRRGPACMWSVPALLTISKLTCSHRQGHNATLAATSLLAFSLLAFSHAQSCQRRPACTRLSRDRAIASEALCTVVADLRLHAAASAHARLPSQHGLGTGSACCRQIALAAPGPRVSARTLPWHSTARVRTAPPPADAAAAASCQGPSRSPGLPAAQTA